MLKEVTNLNKIIIEGIRFADWNWKQYDRPGFERDFCLEESIEYRNENFKALVDAKVENVIWNQSKDNGGRVYNTLLIRFGGGMSSMAAELLDLDMKNILIPNDPATGDAEGNDEYAGDLNGEDIYVCPFGLKYEDGWLTLEVKVFHI